MAARTEIPPSEGRRDAGLTGPTTLVKESSASENSDTGSSPNPAWRSLGREEWRRDNSWVSRSKASYAKRGVSPLRVSRTDASLTSEQPGEEVLAIDEALRRPSELDPRKSQVVELRYFGGLGIEEVAQVMAVSASTVKREWKKARAWLRRELGRGQED